VIDSREDENRAVPSIAGRVSFERLLRMRDKSTTLSSDERIGVIRYQKPGVYVLTPVIKIASDASGWLLSWWSVSRISHGPCIAEIRSSDISSSNRSSEFAATVTLKSMPAVIIL
jgi:hypothetical protein